MKLTIKRLSFPIRKSIDCTNCGKRFQLVIRNRSTQRHTCPSCGQGFTIASREFDAIQKQATQIYEQSYERAFRKAIRDYLR